MDATIFDRRMKFLSTILNRSIASLFVLAVLLVGCSKDECVAPSNHADGVAKGIHVTAVTDQPSNGGLQDSGKDGEDSSISDDGDDVGDGERNKKKKPG